MIGTPEERFFAKVNKTEGGCWIWTGSQTTNGYGQFFYNGKLWVAHRISFGIFSGNNIPDGYQVDHICHERLCVNPEHLRVVTPKQNQENRSGSRKGSKSGIRGVNWDAKNGKWTASVMHNRKNYFLGYFTDKEEAGRVARDKRKELYTNSEEE